MLIFVIIVFTAEQHCVKRVRTNVQYKCGKIQEKCGPE